MKKLNFNLIRKISFIALGAGWLLAAGLFAGISYANYMGYYNEMIELKKELDEANREPVTTLNGITLTIADGKDFFANGKARPIKNDFVLYANFDTDGREFDEEVTDYTLEVPEDFAEEGGIVKATYVYEYTVEEEVPVEGGFEGETEIKEVVKQQTFTDELDIDLTAVAPKALEVVEQPYFVRYKDGDAFNKEGLKVRVRYNDGSTYDDVLMADVNVQSTALAEGDEYATISYDFEGVEVTGQVPVEVMSVANFTNGRVVDLIVEDKLVLSVGQNVTSAVPVVRAVYDSGNKVRLQTGEYTISSKSETVVLGKDYTLEIQSVDFPEVVKKVNIAVVSTVQASTGTLTNCTTSADGIVPNASGASVATTFNVNQSAYIALYANMSNGYIVRTDNKYYTKAFNVNEIIKVYINGKLRPVAATQVKAGGPYDTAEAALAALNNVYLGDFFLNSGENTVKVEYKTSNSGFKTFANGEIFGKLASVGAECYDDSTIFTSFGDYINGAIKNNVTASINVSAQRALDKMAGKGFIEDATSDGKYIYYLVVQNNAAAKNGTSFKQYVAIVKYDPETDTVMGYSKQFYAKSTTEWIYGQCMWLYHKDGYIYTADADGVAKRISVTDLNSNGAVDVSDAPEGEFTFTNAGSIQGMSYISVTQRYAQLENNAVKIYDKDQELINTFTVGRSASGISNAYNMYANKDYVYVLYQKDAIITPYVQIYTWDGTLVKEEIIQNTASIMGYSFTSCNVQTIVEVGSTLYYSLITWTNSPAGVSFIGKAEIDVTKATKYEQISLGEYYDACKAASKDMKFTSSNVKLSGQGIMGIPMYVHGSATDGTYAYVSGANGSGGLRVYKIDIASGNAVGVSDEIDVSDRSPNGDYSFYKDGYYYIALRAATGLDMYRINVAEIDAGRHAGFEVATEFAAFKGTIFGASYNASLNKYAFYTISGQLQIVDAATMTVEKTVSAGGIKQTGIYCDENHIYILRENGNNGGAYMKLYDWSGTLKGDLNLANAFDAKSNNNAQSMFVVNNTIYFVYCAWASTTNAAGATVNNGIYLVKVDLDYSVIS